MVLIAQPRQTLCLNNGWQFSRDALQKGNNELRIEVTNLPANRIADMDRKGIRWRKMNEINVVDINYKKTTYEGWTPVKSGLNSEVRLYQVPR